MHSHLALDYLLLRILDLIFPVFGCTSIWHILYTAWVTLLAFITSFRETYIITTPINYLCISRCLYRVNVLPAMALRFWAHCSAKWLIVNYCNRLLPRMSHPRREYAVAEYYQRNGHSLCLCFLKIIYIHFQVLSFINCNWWTFIIKLVILQSMRNKLR